MYQYEVHLELIGIVGGTSHPLSSTSRCLASQDVDYLDFTLLSPGSEREGVNLNPRFLTG